VHACWTFRLDCLLEYHQTSSQSPPDNSGKSDRSPADCPPEYHQTGSQSPIETTESPMEVQRTPTDSNLQCISVQSPYRLNFEFCAAHRVSLPNGVGRSFFPPPHLSSHHTTFPPPPSLPPPSSSSNPLVNACARAKPGGVDCDLEPNRHHHGTTRRPQTRTLASPPTATSPRTRMPAEPANAGPGKRPTPRKPAPTYPPSPAHP